MWQYVAMVMVVSLVTVQQNEVTEEWISQNL